MAETRRLLILGGTGEARALAERAARTPGLAVTTSLAGRTRAPAAPEGELRTGGFGGADGLAGWLRDNATDAVIDATHPFATEISRNAAEACDAMRVPRLVLRRPPWQAQEGDRWIEVDTPAEAADALAGNARRVFLSVGSGSLSAFSHLADIWFLVRMVDAPETPPPLDHHTVVIGRGPFDPAAETRLLQDHRIDHVVSRNSGGEATYAKIAAARALGLPVVMLRRPPPVAGETVETVDAALDWLDELPDEPLTRYPRT